MKQTEIERLLEIASSSPSESNKQIKNEVKRKSKYNVNVVRFIKSRKIKAGTVRIPVFRLMYEYYMLFGGHSRLKPSRIEFGRIFSQYFESSRSGAYRYYMLSNLEDMSKETMKIAKEYYRKHHLGKTKNEKNKKR